MHGNFFWYDVMTTDTSAAAKFYGDVLGWGTQDGGSPGTDYTAFTLGQRGIAGLMPVPDEVLKTGGRPAWMGYIFVDDVDVAAERIQQEGGRLHRGPFTVPGIIRLAVVSDPQGAGFLIANPLPSSAPPPAFAAGTPGTVGWHELYANDWQSAFAFYEKLFGWTKDQSVDMGPMGTYQLFRTGGELAAGGMMTRPPQVPAAFWGYYFNVAGIDAATARVTGGGGKILNGPMQVPGGTWVVQASDPQGAYFSLVSTQR